MRREKGRKVEEDGTQTIQVYEYLMHMRFKKVLKILQNSINNQVLVMKVSEENHPKEK